MHMSVYCCTLFWPPPSAFEYGERAAGFSSVQKREGTTWGALFLCRLRTVTFHVPYVRRGVIFNVVTHVHPESLARNCTTTDIAHTRAGGNPMACRVATTALEVLREEGMAENACIMGERLRAGLRSLDAPGVELIRGRGLLNAIVVKVGGGGTDRRACRSR